MRLSLTPSQTVGPFFRIGLSTTIGSHVVGEGTPSAVRISGQVLDGAGEPVPDALIETWQPEGVGRCATDEEGHFDIVTIKPARNGEGGAGTGAQRRGRRRDRRAASRCVRLRAWTAHAPGDAHVLP